MGKFFQRPLDVTLDRYSNFRVSQPPHLRHLSIIRDTAQLRRAYHYQHYSYDNFQTLVDRGQVSWDAIKVPTKEKKKRKGQNTTEERVDEDEYGFPTVPAGRFGQKDGWAALDDSIEAEKMEKSTYTTYDPMIRTNAQGQKCRFGNLMQ